MNFALLSTVVDGAGKSASGSSGQGLGMNWGIMAIYIVVVFAAMYFLSIRPQKRRQAQLDEMRKNISLGDSVLLANGMFGKIVDVTAECYIIEFGTNKGVRIPVLKQEVYAKKEPNLTNKPEEQPVPEKKSLSLFGKKAEKTDAEVKEGEKSE